MNKTFKDLLKMMAGNTSGPAVKLIDILMAEETSDASNTIKSDKLDQNAFVLKKKASKAKFCGECEMAQSISANTGFLSNGKKWCMGHSREVGATDTCK